MVPTVMDQNYIQKEVTSRLNSENACYQLFQNILNLRLLGCGLDDRGSGFRFPAGAGNFSLHHRLQNGSGAHPASYPMGTRGLSLGVKRPGREADHSPPSSAEVKE
jgi:hypothetical protein